MAMLTELRPIKFPKKVRSELRHLLQASNVSRHLLRTPEYGHTHHRRAENSQLMLEGWGGILSF